MQQESSYQPASSYASAGNSNTQTTAAFPLDTYTIEFTACTNLTDTNVLSTSSPPYLILHWLALRSDHFKKRKKKKKREKRKTLQRKSRPPTWCYLKYCSVIISSPLSLGMADGSQAGCERWEADWRRVASSQILLIRYVGFDDVMRKRGYDGGRGGGVSDRQVVRRVEMGSPAIQIHASVRKATTKMRMYFFYYYYSSFVSFYLEEGLTWRHVRCHVHPK